MATGTWQIGQSNHDASEASGVVTVAGSGVNLLGGGRYAICLFDVSDGLASGDTIDAATLDLYVTYSFAANPDVVIYCEDADSPAAATTAANNISSRAATTAQVSWSAAGLNVGWATSPDIASAVQEAVNRPGFSGMLAIILQTTPASFFLADEYDVSPSTAARLNLTYTKQATQRYIGTVSGPGGAGIVSDPSGAGVVKTAGDISET